MVVVYGPCTGQEKQDFVDRLNLSVEGRNRDGANMNDIILFNEIISEQGLQEIPLKGRNLTWSNMQDEPLL